MAHNSFALQIKNLQKTYQNGTVALKGITFSVQSGDIFALLGPNGAGKTTTIGIINSLVTKTDGKVFIHGIDIDHDFSKAKRMLGIVPQEYNFNVFETPEQIVVKQAGFYGLPRKKACSQTKHYLKKLDLWDQKDIQARHLSGGTKRRLMLARALVHEPRTLILDEPTAGVDVEIRRLILSYIQDINKQGTTIILTTHYLEEAENICKNVAIINKGNIIVNTDINTILRRLDTETFILNLAKKIKDAPKLPDYKINMIDHSTLEVDVQKEQSINDLFSLLSTQNIDVISLKNKTNRLEELFIKLTN